MIRDKHRVWVRRLLLAFVLVSIGFALGRHSLPATAVAAVQPSGAGETVEVYYLHATFRCATCNAIEKMTRDLLARQFKNELASGAMMFRDANFQTDEALARRFGVVASCVVVAAVRDGRTVEFRRLDEVWTRMKDPKSFDDYLLDAIAAMRQKLSGGKAS